MKHPAAMIILTLLLAMSHPLLSSGLMKPIAHVSAQYQHPRLADELPGTWVCDLSAKKKQGYSKFIFYRAGNSFTCAHTKYIKLIHRNKNKYKVETVKTVRPFIPGISGHVISMSFDAEYKLQDITDNNISVLKKETQKYSYEFLFSPDSRSLLLLSKDNDGCETYLKKI